MPPKATGTIEELRAERSRLREDDLAWLRKLRNTVAAHLDSRLPLKPLLAELDGLSPERLDCVVGAVIEALNSVDRRHPITVLSPLVRLYGKRLHDLER